MKLGSPIFIVLLIMFVFASIAFIVNDFNRYYGTEVGNSSTEYESKFNYYENVSFFMNKAQTQLQQVNDDVGWKKFFGTLYVIPLAVLAVIEMMTGAIPMFSGMLGEISKVLGIPSSISAIAFLAIIIAIIIMLVKFAYKSTTV